MIMWWSGIDDDLSPPMMHQGPPLFDRRSCTFGAQVGLPLSCISALGTNTVTCNYTDKVVFFLHFPQNIGL